MHLMNHLLMICIEHLTTYSLHLKGLNIPLMLNHKLR